MSADLVSVADAVVTAYSGGHATTPPRLSQHAHYARRWKATWKLTDLAEFDAAAPVSDVIRVTIVPLREETVLAKSQRSRLWIEYQIYVGMAGKPKSLDVETHADALALLAQELRDFFFAPELNGQLADRAEVATGIETLDHPDRDVLLTKGVFLADFVLTFSGWRSR